MSEYTHEEEHRTRKEDSPKEGQEMNEEYYPEEEKKFSLVREAYDWVEAGITAMIFAVLLFTFAGRLIGVDGVSMLPTLETGDRLIATRMFYTPSGGDIVVITDHNDRHIPLVKRVIATEGQTIDIDFEQGRVYVDGAELDEPYINEPTLSGAGWDYPLTVPEGCVFVMGDNRNNSWDSRFEGVGMLDQRYILGKVVYRLTPYDKMGVPQ